VNHILNYAKLVVFHPKTCWDVLKEVSFKDVSLYYAIFTIVFFCEEWLLLNSRSVAPITLKTVSFLFFTNIILQWVMTFLFSYIFSQAFRCLGYVKNFEITFKMMVFSGTPFIFSFLISPFPFPFSSLLMSVIHIWIIALMAIGLKTMYDISYGKTIGGLLLGVLFSVMFMFCLAVPVGFILGLLGFFP
jgi:Yip1 domain